MMDVKYVRSLLLILLLATQTVVAAVTPLEVFGGLPSIEDIALSPDGKQIAFVSTRGDERTILISNVADMKPFKAWGVGSAKLRQLIWGDDNHLLVLTSSAEKPMELSGGKSEFLLLQSCEVKTGKCYNPISMMTLAPMLNTIVRPPQLREINGKTVVYVVGLIAENGIFMPNLFRFNVGEPSGVQIVSRGTQHRANWLLDEGGGVAAIETYSEVQRLWQLKVRVGAELKQVMSVKTDIEQPSIIGFSPDGSAVWLEVPENGETVRKAVSLTDGAITLLPMEMQRYENLLSHRWSSRIDAGRMLKSNDIDFFDNRMRETWRVIFNRFSNERVDVISATPDFGKVVVRVEGERDGYIYVLFDADSYEFASLGKVYSGLDQVAKVKPLVYRAADGFEVPGFVTIPPGRTERKLPLVVLPHGGPATRDVGMFDWLAQAIAAQGYVVLQPNYRGSDLGWRHLSAGFGEWGGKMQTDLSDGVRHLVNSGLVDPARVCIVGGSYGGYAALAGATLDLGVYRCAVSIAGVSDLDRYQGWISQKMNRSDTAFGRYFDRYIGASGPGDPLRKARSPAQQVANVTIPILLLHGRDDSVVPFEQSQIMADALKRAGKSYELIALKNEDHWLSRSATRLQALQETVRFLRQYNPPD